MFRVAIISLIFALASRQHFSSYYVFYGSLFAGTVFITARRQLHLQLTAWVLDRVRYRRHAILVGSGSHARAVAQALASRSHTKVDIVRYVTLDAGKSNRLRLLGSVDRLPSVLTSEAVQELILADPELPQDETVELVDLCHQPGVSVYLAPMTMEILMERAKFVPGQSMPLFTLRPPVFEGLDYAVKRTVDLTFSVLGLILLAPLMLAIKVVLAVR